MNLPALWHYSCNKVTETCDPFFWSYILEDPVLPCRVLGHNWTWVHVDPMHWAGRLFTLVQEDLNPASAPWCSPDLVLLGPPFYQLTLNFPGSSMKPETLGIQGSWRSSMPPAVLHEGIQQSGKLPSPRGTKAGGLFKGMAGGCLYSWTSSDSLNFSERCSVRNGFAGSSRWKGPLFELLSH